MINPETNNVYEFEIIVIVSCKTNNCFFDDAPVSSPCMTLAIAYLAGCRRLLCPQPLPQLCFSFSVSKIITLQYKNLEKMMKLFVLNLIYPLFVSNLQMVSFYVSYLVEQFQESEAGPCYNMYHPQHYLLHELPSINENHCCDIIKANDSRKIRN